MPSSFDRAQCNVESEASHQLSYIPEEHCIGVVGNKTSRRTDRASIKIRQQVAHIRLPRQLGTNNRERQRSSSRDAFYQQDRVRREARRREIGALKQVINAQPCRDRFNSRVTPGSQLLY
jgi:hypothetical protein